MAIYYTDRQKDEIRAWLLELREIVSPDKFAPNRERAHELVALLDQHRVHPACLIAYEFGRLRRIWRRLDAQSE
jgi:hypothetical protein